MKSAWKVIAYPILCGVLIGGVAGCSAKKPASEDYSDALAMMVEGYDIKGLKCESFADRSQEKAGRASCSGSLALIYDLYGAVPDERVRQQLVSAGVPAEGATFFRRRHPQSIFEKTAIQGAETPLTAECSYWGGVDGWNINCSPSYSRHHGRSQITLGNDAVLVGSPEHAAYTREVLDDHQRLEAKFQEVKSGLERFFARGQTISNGDGTVRAQIGSQIVWSGERGFLGHESAFRIESKYQDRRENRGQTFCGYRIGSPSDDILFEGSIGFSKDRQSGEETFPAYVEMFNRAAQYQNRFFGCGNRLKWNDGGFGGGFSGRSILRSE